MALPLISTCTLRKDLANPGWRRVSQRVYSRRLIIRSKYSIVYLPVIVLCVGEQGSIFGHRIFNKSGGLRLEDYWPGDS